MDNLKTTNSIVIRHQPYGERHPYIPLPYERSPRDPSSGEPVILNIETEHSPTADSVWCEWNAAGNPAKNRVDAALISRGENLDHWQAALPAFAGGEEVNYRIFAQNDDQKVKSENYSFEVTTWVSVSSVVAVHESGKHLDVNCATQCSGLFVNLRMELDASSNLSFKLSTCREESNPQSINNTNLSISWGDLQIALQESPFAFELKRNSDGLVIKSAEPLQVLINNEGAVLNYRLGFASPTDEAFYGFGERFNALDQRGNHLDNYVYGQYTSQGKRTYIPIPFFVSSRRYGLWLKTSRQAQFDLAAASPDCWVLEGQAEDNSSLEMTWFFQPQPYDIIRAFTDLVGKPKTPPAWAFGLWMSSNDWNSQAEVIKQLHETQRLQIPASVLVIEAWSDEINFYIWNDAKYRLKPSSQALSLAEYHFPPAGRWPDPKSMIDELHQSGLRLVLWQNSVIKFGESRESLDETINQTDQAYAIEKGYVILKADGTPHRAELHMPWFRNSLVFDFSNPEAVDWWFSKRKYLINELGVDGFKTDGGEHIWDVNTRFHNGKCGSEGINEYPLYYEGAYDRFMQEKLGRDFVLFSRAGYTGAQQYPCHWAGDENSTWDAFRATLRALLNAGVSGLPFVGWDIAGFAGPIPTSELYLRAAAFSVFCPIMQYHSDVNNQQRTSRDRTPWNIQEQTGNKTVIPVFRRFTNLRMNMIPYIVGQARLSSQSGLPLMRALPLEYPQDQASKKFPFEYLFGDALLVAPVIEEGKSSWQVYLPKGEWADLWSGEILRGAREIVVDVPLDRIPVFIRKGSILPLNLDASLELCSPVGNSTEDIKTLAVMIFPGDAYSGEVYQGTGKPAIQISVSQDVHETVQVRLDGSTADLDLLILGDEPNHVEVDGQTIPRLEADGIIPDSYWKRRNDPAHTQVHLPKNASSCTVHWA